MTPWLLRGGRVVDRPWLEGRARGSSFGAACENRVPADGWREHFRRELFAQYRNCLALQSLRHEKTPTIQNSTNGPGDLFARRSDLFGVVGTGRASAAWKFEQRRACLMIGDFLRLVHRAVHGAIIAPSIAPSITPSHGVMGTRAQVLPQR